MPVSNEKNGNFTFYRSIHDFFEFSYFEKIMDFTIKINAVISVWRIWQNRNIFKNNGIQNCMNTTKECLKLPDLSVDNSFSKRRKYLFIDFPDST